MTGPEPWTEEELQLHRQALVNGVLAPGCSTEKWLATLDDARIDLTLLRSAFDNLNEQWRTAVKQVRTANEEITRLRAENEKLQAFHDADVHRAEEIDKWERRAAQAEQRVLELKRDLSDTTAECEFRAETIAAYWDERVKLEQRLAESQADVGLLKQTVKLCYLAGPSPVGPLYGIGWNAAVDYVLKQLDRPIQPFTETPKPAAGGEGA